MLLHMHYICVAAQSSSGSHKTHMLQSGVSETLKVEPVRKVIRTVMVAKGGALEKAGNVINLLFEGNWMPIKVRLMLLYRSFLSLAAMRQHMHALLAKVMAPLRLRTLDCAVCCACQLLMHLRLASCRNAQPSTCAAVRESAACGQIRRPPVPHSQSCPANAHHNACHANRMWP